MEKEGGMLEKRHFKISRRGRPLKRPKKLMTTSSDETAKYKKQSRRQTMQTEIDRLRLLLKEAGTQDTRKALSENEISPNKRSDVGTSKATIELLKKAKHIETDSFVSSSPKSIQSPCISKRVSPVLWTPRQEISQEDSCSKCKNILDRLSTLHNENELLIKYQIEIKEMLQEVIRKCDVGDINTTKSLYEPLEGFPLQTLEEFIEMESDNKKSERKKLYRHLLGIGGSKLRDFLHSSLKEIMTDHLVCKFTWPGGAGSKQFGNTKILNVLYLAAQKCTLFHGPDNKSEFKANMQEVLRSVKQRYRKKLKKTATTVQMKKSDAVDESLDSENETDYESDL